MMIIKANKDYPEEALHQHIVELAHKFGWNQKPLGRDFSFEIIDMAREFQKQVAMNGYQESYYNLLEIFYRYKTLYSDGWDVFRGLKYYDDKLGIDFDVISDTNHHMLVLYLLCKAEEKYGLETLKVIKEEIEEELKNTAYKPLTQTFLVFKENIEKAVSDKVKNLSSSIDLKNVGRV